MCRGPTSGFLAVVSFGLILLTTRLNKVSEAVNLHETSIIFAALIG